MFLDICLQAALIVFILGLIYRITRWFRFPFSCDLPGRTGWQRFATVVRKSIQTLFSIQFFHLLRSVLVDGIFQARILKTSVWRWVMHLFMFAGFILLLVFHVFDQTFTVPLFREYAPALNPFMALRNVFGSLVLVGLAFAVIRRLTLRRRKVLSNSSDLFLILITGIIIASGFFLEAAKIVSEAVYDDMVDEYADMDDEEQEEALKALWSEDFHVSFESRPGFAGEDMRMLGEEMHEEFCAACHSRPKSAFVSVSLVSIFKPLSAFSNAHRLDRVFFYIHYLATLIGLALLPFTKAFHIIVTPLSMTLCRVFNGHFSHPDTRSVKRMIELDACVHCGACSSVCSVGPIHTILQNEAILPSEKLRSIVRMTTGGGTDENCERLLDGSIICTDCYRCNEVCPVGIDLRGLWLTARRSLENRGYIPPLTLVTQKPINEWAPFFKKHEPHADTPISSTHVTQIIDNPEFFSDCVQCTTCANVCPVVACMNKDARDPGMSPQQVMNLLRLEMKEEASVAGMTWNCATCYQCQEYCPRNIPVSEILNELRARGFSWLRQYLKNRSTQDDRP